MANYQQLYRMLHFIAALRKNEKITIASYCEKLKAEDKINGTGYSASLKTIQRDIKALREDFNAPIEYSKDKLSYCLTNPNWSLNTFLDEDTMTTAILGASASSSLFPQDMNNSIQKGADIILADNQTNYSKQNLDALIVQSGLKTDIKNIIFETIFEGWKNHIKVDISYEDAQGNETERVIEPHALVFADGTWFVKAHCAIADNYRVFAIQRILFAELLEDTFIPNNKVIQNIKKHGLYSFDEVKNIKITCDKTLRKYVMEKPLHPNQVVTDNPDDTFQLDIPLMIKYQLINWILNQGGLAVLNEPTSVRSKIQSIANEISYKHY